MKHGVCDFIDNLTSSPSPSVFFTPVPTLTVLTLFKCRRSHNIDLIAEYNYTSCQDYIIHYNHSNHIPPTPPPPGCSIIQYPVNISTVGIANLFPLLTSDITLEVHVFPHCWNCLRREGQCQDDEKGKFQCHAHVKGALHINNLSSFLFLSFILVFFLFSFSFFLLHLQTCCYACSMNSSLLTVGLWYEKIDVCAM